MHLWFFFLASNPLSRRFGVCHLVIDSDFVIMAGADVPQARDYRSPGGQQLLAAHKAICPRKTQKDAKIQRDYA